MNLEKVIDEIIYNLKPVYNELGLDRNEIDVRLIDMDECDEDDDILAWCNSKLFCNGDYTYEIISAYKMNHNSSIKFDIEFEKCIYISEKVLYDTLDLIYDKTNVQNDELYDYILVALLEYVIIHELRHMYQFKSLKQISLQYVDVLFSSNNTWNGIFDYEIKSLFERDAINYAHYKSNLTILKNSEIKNLISNIIYGTELLSTIDDETDIVEGIEDSIEELGRVYHDFKLRKAIKESSDNNTKDLFSKIKKLVKNLTCDYECSLNNTLKKFGIR